MNSQAGAREWAKTETGIFVPGRDIVRPRGFGLVTVRDRAGHISQEYKFKNLITNPGLNALLASNISTASLYFGMMNNAPGTNTASGTASSGSITLGTSASLSAKQWITIVGAGNSGNTENYVGQIVSGSGTSYVVSPVLGGTVSGAIAVIGPLFSATDTYSGSHSTWAELSSTISGSTSRPAFAQNVIGSNIFISNSGGTLATWTFGGSTQWVGGFFLIENATVGTTGTLISEFVPGASGVGGALSVSNGNTVTLTYTLALSSADT